jgi:WD40 repeat protein
MFSHPRLGIGWLFKPSNGSSRLFFNSLLAVMLVTGAGCKRNVAPPLALTVGPSKTVADLGARGVKISAATSERGSLALGTVDGRVLLLERGDRHAAPRELGAEALHAGPVVALDFSRDGRRLLSVGGRSVVVWDTSSGEKIRRVEGPQALTAAVIAPDAKSAFFGTSHGHVLRWRVDQKGADQVKGFACGGERVYPSRMGLPPHRRCPIGSYQETPEGLQICLYPVTHLLLQGEQLVRACRTGALKLLDLRSDRTTYLHAGHLSVLIAVGRSDLLLGRAAPLPNSKGGHLRLVRTGEKKPHLELEPSAPPAAAASDGQLIAVALRGAVRLWHKGDARTVGMVPVTDRVIWLDLERSGGRRGKRLRILLSSGKLLERGLTIVRTR